MWYTPKNYNYILPHNHIQTGNPNQLWKILVLKFMEDIYWVYTRNPYVKSLHNSSRNKIVYSVNSYLYALTDPDTPMFPRLQLLQNFIMNYSAINSYQKWKNTRTQPFPVLSKFQNDTLFLSLCDSYYYVMNFRSVLLAAYMILNSIANHQWHFSGIFKKLLFLKKDRR